MWTVLPAVGAGPGNEIYMQTVFTVCSIRDQNSHEYICFEIPLQGPGNETGAPARRHRFETGTERGIVGP